MEVSIVRDTYSPNCVTGKMYVDGTFECFTMEPRADQSQGKPFCIPEGRYQIALQMSPHFGFVTPHVLDVPNFSEIEWHPGNIPRDTHGCVLVGETRSADFVGVSVVAFNALMAKLNAAQGEIWATYSSLQVAVDPEIGT